MRIAYKKGEHASVREGTLRALKPGEIRIQVDACGVCGTDLHLVPGVEPREEPFGHEMAGTVLECGPGVVSHKPGMKVAVESSAPCGWCSACHDGRQEFCINVQSFFCGGTYGFADEAIVPAITALPAEGLDPAVASLSEPLGVAIDMFRLSDISINSNVLVMGPGPIGLMALALLRRAGVRRLFMSGHDRRPARRAVAERIGIDGWIDPTKTPLETFNFGAPIDRIFVTCPPKNLSTAFQLAAKGGIITFIGIENGEGAFCRFDANAFHFKKLQLRASFASPALYTPLALQYLKEGVVDGEMLISHRIPLAEIDRALAIARNDPDAVKVVVTR